MSHSNLILDLRSYSADTQVHHHDFHQLVLPVAGSLSMTPRQYLIEKRMQRAWQLLAEGGLQVQQVAEQVGYGNLAAFSDRFRRHFGRSPSYFARSTNKSAESTKTSRSLWD